MSLSLLLASPMVARISETLRLHFLCPIELPAWLILQNGPCLLPIPWFMWCGPEILSLVLFGFYRWPWPRSTEHRLGEQKPLYDRPLQSQGGDTVEAHRRGEPRNLIHFRQRSVGLDSKDTHGSNRRVERVEELAIAADRDVKVRGVFRVACDDRGRGERGQCPALADRKSGDVRATGIRCVDKSAIRSDCIPAVGVAVGRQTLRDSGKPSVRKHCVGRDCRNGGTRLRNNQLSIGSEPP